jgi:predicted cupin superfamily sugar epimerase
MLTVDEIKSMLRLEPHPREGGFFAETYRSAETIDERALPSRYRGTRAFSTAIYYLLTSETFSEMHRLATDEIFHFYLGDSAEMLQLGPDGSATVRRIGADLLRGETPQLIVPRGVWQGTRLAPGGRFALLGTTVAPGFDFADYETGQREDLIKSFPLHRELITALTRK